MDEVNPDLVMQLRRLGMPWAKIARAMNVSRNSMYKFRLRNGLDEPNHHPSHADLGVLVHNIVTQNPTWGSVTIRGALLSIGQHASENRIQRILKVVYPLGAVCRRQRRLVRRKFFVPGANHLW